MRDLMVCPWCGGVTRPFMKNGHYDCGRCNKPVEDCCDGETAENATREELHSQGFEQAKVSSANRKNENAL